MIEQKNMFLTDKEFADLQTELGISDLKFIDRPESNLLIYGYNWTGRKAGETISLRRIDGVLKYHNIIDKSVDS